MGGFGYGIDPGFLVSFLVGGTSGRGNSGIAGEEKISGSASVSVVSVYIDVDVDGDGDGDGGVDMY